jgi:adenine-specific DNA-methyltransferase
MKAVAKNFNHSFEDIRLYFNKLNEDTSHFINSNDICTPIECVKEMVDALPLEFWNRKNLKILDSCCGNGNFHAYIQTKTSLSNLYFNEINEKRLTNLLNYFGKNINITTKDFLEFEEKEEYDLVVSNPPYAKFNTNGRTSKNHNLSRDFIKKALQITKIGGYILFIVPNNWMSFSDRNILPKELTKYQFLHINIHGVKRWFPKVGSSFTWFLLHKVPNNGECVIENNYYIKDTQAVKLPENQNFIPLYASQIVYDILEKTLNNKLLPKYKIETTSDLHRTTKSKFISNFQSEEYCHKLIHTPTQTVWSKIPHKFQDGWKVFIPLTNQYSTFIEASGMTQSIAFIRCKTREEALKIKEELDSDIYKFLNNITRYGNFNNIRILQNFPLLSSFSLTKAEMDFVKHFNEKYYSKNCRKNYVKKEE